jgi:DNA/RNA-binding domain of Phe-tRNA-synthetase-like protein
MKRFVTEDSFWELFPGASFGVVVAQNMKSPEEVDPEAVAEIAHLLDRANLQAEKHLVRNALSENAAVRVWREAYRQFKTKRGARCSIENLLKRVLKGNPVGSISPSVDIYNTVSLRHALPLGGEDIDTFRGDLRLTITEGGDAFTPLGEHAEDDPTLPGELCYVDDAGAVCRCWNWRDGVRTALTDNTRNAFLIVECVDPERIEDCRTATDELAAMVEQYLGATIAVKELVTSDNREVVIKK